MIRLAMPVVGTAKAAGRIMALGMDQRFDLRKAYWKPRVKNLDVEYQQVDLDRVMILRTASDFDQPVPGESPAASLARNKIGKYTGCGPAIDAAWRVGRVVMAELVKTGTNTAIGHRRESRSKIK